MTLEYILQQHRFSFHQIYGQNPSKEMKEKYTKWEKKFIKQFIKQGYNKK